MVAIGTDIYIFGGIGISGNLNDFYKMIQLQEIRKINRQWI